MIFTLDDDLEGLKLSDSENSVERQQQPTALYDEIDEIDENLNLRTEPIPLLSDRSRRRSSVLEKFPVSTPPRTRRISVTSASNPVGDSYVDRESLIYGDRGISRCLADFKPVRVLGKGAYGKVILVRDQQTSKLYAMKQLLKAEILLTEENECQKDEKDVSKLVERTFAERTILSELEHPNIVKLFYTFHDNAKLYLLLQYIPGGELFFHLKEQGTLDEDTVAFYAAEISCALKFLHGKGIVYRDLKPENCLLDQNGHLVLTDFGLSKKSVEQQQVPFECEEVTNLYSIIGTPEYCAPEVLQGIPYTKKCDWYSLGCLMYDMLIGKPPHTGANHKVILNKIQKDNPRIPHYLSDGMKDMLSALLKKEHTKRWDVDKYWRTTPEPKQKRKRKKAGQEKTSGYTSHFIFRKINWPKLETGEIQRSEPGPILPLITDWALAENFDSEFTSMSYEDTINGIDINIPKSSSDYFKGFSYKASCSYLERHF
ncbi:hypothetical protein HG537_0D03890 [Torulaspora globosa]|uniref:Kinase-like protein n=1 Tax=Torulaspora globosa TaxID=48254 RepID=A0A7H9HRL3_9SACH|nr:hypothetical protein HG537_0D03890 [Torulaspora sp. CBS 2947]